MSEGSEPDTDSAGKGLKAAMSQHVQCLPTLKEKQISEFYLLISNLEFEVCKEREDGDTMNTLSGDTSISMVGIMKSV